MVKCSVGRVWVRCEPNNIKPTPKSEYELPFSFTVLSVLVKILVYPILLSNLFPL